MKKKKKTGGSPLTVLAILLAAALVFRDHAGEILENLKAVPLWGTAALLALAAAYQLLESGICAVLVRSRLPGFSFRTAMEVTFLGVFGNVATFAVGSIPMQSLYLRRNGLSVGSGVGLMTVEYIFHKSSILLYAAVMLLFQGAWLREAVPEVSGYLLAGFGVCAAVTAVLVLLCAWERLEKLALRLLALLPDTGKWAGRRDVWQNNLEALYTESQAILKNRSCRVRVFLLNGAKLFCLYSAAWLAVYLLGADLPFQRAQLLSSLMLLIASALPNVAGVGPAEFAFLLLFGRYLSAAGASAALVLYRAATYFFPFAASIPFALRVQHRSRTSPDEGDDSPCG